MELHEFCQYFPRKIDLRPAVQGTIREWIKHNPNPDAYPSEPAIFFNKVISDTKFRRNKFAFSEGSYDNAQAYLAAMNAKDASKRGGIEFARAIFFWFFKYCSEGSYFIQIAEFVWADDEEILSRFVHAKSCQTSEETFDDVFQRFKSYKRHTEDEVDLHIAQFGAFKVSLNRPTRYKLTIKHRVNRPLVLDGQKDILAALHWETELTGLHGRLDEFNRLKSWANTPSEKQVKVMLVSGPGGAGKSRLAAQIVSHLVNEEGWSGGFPLRNLASPSIELDGTGKGVALVLDYPEEDTQRVRQVLDAAANSVEYNKPIRIILTSRENKETWLDRLRQIEVPRFEEIALGDQPFLPLSDAVAMTEDVAATYAEETKSSPREFSNIAEWLNKEASHRLPLNILAASVHAVICPADAFHLGVDEVLRCLSKIELKRIRSYSKRELGHQNETCLERAIALACLMPQGIKRKLLYDLSKSSLFNGISGVALAEAISRTPFWVQENREFHGHLASIEPDRVAARLVVDVIRLHETFASEYVDAISILFAHSLNDALSVYPRFFYDVSLIDIEYSKEFERLYIEAIGNKNLYAENDFTSGIEYYNPLSFNLFDKLLSNSIRSTNDTRKKADFLAERAILLGEIADFEGAIVEYNRSIEAYKSILNEDDYYLWLAMSEAYQNCASCYFESGLLEKAAWYLEAALKIEKRVERLFRNKRVILNHESHNLYALIQSALKSHALAIRHIAIAIRMRREADDKGFSQSFDVATYLTNEASILSDSWKSNGNRSENLAALNSAEQAVDTFNYLMEEKRELVVPSLASALLNFANRKFENGLFMEAVQLNAAAIQHYEHLANLQPEPYLDDLTLALSNRAFFLLNIKKTKEALRDADVAVTKSRNSAQIPTNTSLRRLSTALGKRGMVFAELKKNSEAAQDFEEAIEIYRTLKKQGVELSETESITLLENYATILFRQRKWKQAFEASSERFSLQMPILLATGFAFLKTVLGIAYATKRR